MAITDGFRGGKLGYPRVTRRGFMQGCAERAAAQHAPRTPNISLHGARYAAGMQPLSAALKQSSHRASYFHLGLPAQTPALSEKITV